MAPGPSGSGKSLQAIDPAPSAVLAQVLGGPRAEVERDIDGQAVHSVVLPVRRPDGGTAGAFEVAQPLAFVEAEIRRTGQRFLLNTLTLLAALTAVIPFLVRRLVSEPLDRLVAGSRALGGGDLAYRIRQPGGGELAVVAEEFNRRPIGRRELAPSFSNVPMSGCCSSGSGESPRRWRRSASSQRDGRTGRRLGPPAEQDRTRRDGVAPGLPLARQRQGAEKCHGAGCGHRFLG